MFKRLIILILILFNIAVVHGNEKAVETPAKAKTEVKKGNQAPGWEKKLKKLQKRVIRSEHKKEKRRRKRELKKECTKERKRMRKHKN